MQNSIKSQWLLVLTRGLSFYTSVDPNMKRDIALFNKRSPNRFQFLLRHIFPFFSVRVYGVRGYIWRILYFSGIRCVILLKITSEI